MEKRNSISSAEISKMFDIKNGDELMSKFLKGQQTNKGTYLGRFDMGFFKRIQKYQS